MESRIKRLCKRAGKADRNAACELLEIYYAEIYAYLRRLCGNRADAEDLTQQTFLKVWSSLDGFKGRSRFSTWLYSIARNTCIDYQRKNSGKNPVRSEQWLDECIDDNPGPFANVAERQSARRLYETVEQLDEDKREIVHLHYYQGLSLKQTAEVLGIANSTVKYRLREVFKILRARLTVSKTEIRQEQTIAIPEGE